MSDWRGIRNLSGSAATSAARSSRGKAKPIWVSSREKARYTMRPTRNFTRSRTKTSYERGSLFARARTSSIVTIAHQRYGRDAMAFDGHDYQSRFDALAASGVDV